jgi:hypothetical protein
MSYSIDQKLDSLSKSKFRSSFHLNSDDISYINEKGMETIRLHAVDFVSKRLAPAYPANDGKQTPMKGHPVFKAMHATACCCRGCLHKWYGITLHRELTEQEISMAVSIIIAWINRQLNQ